MNLPSWQYTSEYEMDQHPQVQHRRAKDVALGRVSCR